MPVTTTKKRSVRDALNSGNPADIATAMERMQSGNMAAVVKVTTTGLTSASAFDITTAAVKAAATVAGLTLAVGENLPAAGMVQSVRVTAGAAAAGLRQIGDAAATASATVAKLSDDGKTLTFEAGVTAFILVYIPRAAVAPDATDIQTLS